MMLTGAAVGRFVGELVFLTFPDVPIDPRFVLSSVVLFPSTFTDFRFSQ